MNETLQNILSRQTLRKYTSQPLTDEQVHTLLKCAENAPSARNAQSCYVSVTSNKEILEKLNCNFKDFVGWNTPAYTSWQTNPFYQGAPTVFFIFTKNEQSTSYADMDSGIMVENIAIGAKSMGLDSCIIGSAGNFLRDEKGKKSVEMLGFDESFTFRIAIAVGHADDNPPKKERNDDAFFEVK